MWSGGASSADKLKPLSKWQGFLDERLIKVAVYTATPNAYIAMRVICKMIMGNVFSVFVDYALSGPLAIFQNAVILIVFFCQLSTRASWSKAWS